MKNYKITYSGNSTKFKRVCPIEFQGENERDAVESFYKYYLDAAYYPQEDGSILDDLGREVASSTSATIEYDGGYFAAHEIEEEV